MIPITVTNKDGSELYTQVFNDSLSVQEQINRKLVGAIFGAQMALTNGDYAVSKKISEGAFTSAELDTINTAADTLVKALQDAIKAFEGKVPKK